MTKQRIFIGSSTEAVKIAETLQESLNHEFDCVVWNQVELPLGRTSLEWLVEESNKYDYAIFVYAADDIAELRGHNYLVARDNVVLEHGLFLGSLGRERVFFLTPNDPALRIPTDLAGVLHGKYDPVKIEKDRRKAVAGFCQQVKSAVANVESGSGIILAADGEIWEVAKISDAHSKSVRLESSRRIEYEPAHFHYREDRRRSRADLNFYMSMHGQGFDFEGPVRGSGPVRDGWAYMVYEGIDELTRKNVTGVCAIRMPAIGPTVGYWMTQDSLSDAGPTGIVFGAAVLKAGE